MAIHDLTSQRLFVSGDLAAGRDLVLSETQKHYLVHVLRQKIGSAVLVFNGRDGEWRARLRETKKRSAMLEIEEQVRPQTGGPDLVYVFAPLKRSRLDYMVQKATEMGVSRLQPVLTDHAIAERVNLERMHANAIEAAEQCGVLRVPEVCTPVALKMLLAQWDAARALIFCDEAHNAPGLIESLKRIPAGAFAVLVGPEGGFSASERTLLRSHVFVHPISLGPRVMRADTAAVAALALVNATIGDWR